MKDTVFKYLSKALAYKPVADWIINRSLQTPYTHIPPQTGEYMKRYWLIKEDGWLSRLIGISARVHFINSPDHDRDMHTHPFTFRTFVLRGSYVEQRRSFIEFYLNGQEVPQMIDRSAGSTYQLDSDTPHMIEWVEPGTVSLFVYGRRVGDWFFQTHEGRIPHETYLKDKEIE